MRDRNEWSGMAGPVAIAAAVGLVVSIAHAMPEQVVLPQGATDRVWGLVTDEALTLGLVMVAGILSTIGLVGLARLIWRKPQRSRYGVNDGFQYQRDYDNWHHRMTLVATFGGLAWIFALELIALGVMAQERYGILPRIIVALTPAMIGCWLVRPVYNFVRRKGQDWGLIARPQVGEESNDPDDVTRL